MKNTSYKLTLILLFVGIIIANTQTIEKNFSKELPIKKGTIVSLQANYADIEIIEWDKNKIKVDAVMTANGVSEKDTKSYFEFWEMELINEGDKVKIISRAHNSHFSHSYDNFNFEAFNFDDFNFEMPELSLESLSVLDSMDFSFPEINFSEVINDSLLKNINSFHFSFGFSPDSLNVYFNNLDFEKLKINKEYLKNWQEKNKLLQEKRMEAHQERMEAHKERMNGHHERMEAHKERMKEHQERTREHRKRNKKIQKRSKTIAKKQKERHDRINSILNNRKKTKVRTKLIIRVPKGTTFEMNVNYSTIKSN